MWGTSKSERVWVQCPTPATQKPPAMHIVPRLPRKRGGNPSDARAYIDPLAVHIVPRLPHKRGGDPRDAQGVHPTPWQCTLSHACHAKEAETQATPGRTSDPLAVHIAPRLPRNRGGDPRDARAYIRPLGSAHCPTLATQKRRRPKGRQGVHPTLGRAHCPTPATQKKRRPKGRQGVHPTPWQCTLRHACHAEDAETQGTPGRTSDPLAVHIVPRLPRKRGGDSRDARAYIRPFGSAHCPTPATQKRRRPRGRQGVHPTPWQCILSHACHAKEAETQGTPGRTSDPFAVHIVPRKRGGDPGEARAYFRSLGTAHCPTPATQKRRRPKGRQGVHPTPWQCTLCHACHAKEAETQGTPLSHACHAKEAETQATPGRTSDPLAVHIVPRLPRKRGGDPRDARAYIRPLGSATHPLAKRRRPKGRQGVHPTPWQCTLSHACHAKEAKTQGTPGRTSDPLAMHIVPRLPRKRGGDPRDARAYIRPLGSAHCSTPATQKRWRPKGRQGVQPTPWQCTLCHACHAKEAETQGTPGRTSDPVAMDRHCPTPATQKRRRPKGRQGVHPTPWQCTLCHACHAKEAESQGMPGRTSDPVAMDIVPRLPRKRGGDPRDARAYIRPLGSAHCATPATQKRRRPKRRQGVHPTPWQCTLSHACHTKEAETQGTPGRTSDPLAVHIVPRLPRKRGEWVCVWVSEWVGEWVRERDWVSEWASEWVSMWGTTSLPSFLLKRTWTIAATGKSALHSTGHNINQLDGWAIWLAVTKGICDAGQLHVWISMSGRWSAFEFDTGKENCMPVVPQCSTRFFFASHVMRQPAIRSPGLRWT